MGHYHLSCGGIFALVIAAGLSGCGKMKDRVPEDASHLRSTAKRLQASCASTVANQKLKGRLFDQAIAQHTGDRTNLDTLADYSTLRMEAPIVEGRDDSLDVTKCAGRLILDIPPGAECGLGGERQLQGDIHYTAQASADGNGFVYRLSGAEPLVARLASFNLTSVAFRPPPAIDQQQPGAAAPPSIAQVQAQPRARMDAPEPRIAVATVQPDVNRNRSPRGSQRQPSRMRVQKPTRLAARNTTDSATERSSHSRAERPAPVRTAEIAPQDRPETTATSGDSGSGDAVVRAFYGSLRAGDGASAAAHVVPEKRSSGPYSSGAMTRFYGGLAEPIQLLGVTPAGAGRYRVRYHYSAGRSSCSGSAIVGVTNRGGQDLIRSIRALNGC
jgi:hypothetical protein